MRSVLDYFYSIYVEDGLVGAGGEPETLGEVHWFKGPITGMTRNSSYKGKGEGVEMYSGNRNQYHPAGKVPGLWD